MFEIRYIEIYFCCVAFNAIRTTEITADSEAWKNSKRLIRFEVLQVQAPEVIANHDEKSDGRRKGGGGEETEIQHVRIYFWCMGLLWNCMYAKIEHNLGQNLNVESINFDLDILLFILCYARDYMLRFD